MVTNNYLWYFKTENKYMHMVKMSMKYMIYRALLTWCGLNIVVKHIWLEFEFVNKTTIW